MSVFENQEGLHSPVYNSVLGHICVNVVVLPEAALDSCST